MQRIVWRGHESCSGTTNMRTVNAVGRLIDACIDDERMLEHESRFLQGHRREVLQQLAGEEALFVRRLRAFDFGDDPDTLAHNGSWMELAREFGRSLRVIAGGPNDSDSVSACRRSCVRTGALFDKVLDLPWPDPMRRVLIDHQGHLEAARNALTAIQY